MKHISTVLNQFLQIIPHNEFDKLVKQLKTDHYTKHFKSWNLMTVLMIAQAKGQDSLRHIVTSLRHHKNTWAHLGIKQISKSTLADGNSRVNPALFEQLFYVLLKKTQGQNKGYTGKKKGRFRFKNPVYSMDSSTIDLCLSLFDWATFRRRKGAIKLHMLLDTRSHLPSVAIIKEGCHHDSKLSSRLTKDLLPDSIVVFDKAYIDYTQFEAYREQKIWFVTRSKMNMRYDIIGDTGQHLVTPQKEGKGVVLDQEILVTAQKKTKQQPSRTLRLRLITFKNPDDGRVYEFLTNNFKLAASSIAELYKSRWQVELFFKMIKQQLQVTSFLGTSKNAVMNQLWAALCYLLLVRYIKHQTRFQGALIDLLRLINEALFERISFIDLLGLSPPDIPFASGDIYQMELI